MGTLGGWAWGALDVGREGCDMDECEQSGMHSVLRNCPTRVSVRVTSVIWEVYIFTTLRIDKESHCKTMCAYRI